jgi:hypothetical protein
MKRFILSGTSFLLMTAAIVLSRSTHAGADDELRSGVIKLYQSLTEDQKKLAVLDLQDKDRFSEVFPAAKRPGIPYTKLQPEQKAIIEEVVKTMTSEYGAKRCFEIMKETPEGARYLTFFGEPSKTKPFAWRVGMHHLTLLFADFGSEPASEFGPILLGGNPAKSLWEAEEKIALELYASLKPEELRMIQESAKGVASSSGAKMGKGGMQIADLNEKARSLAVSLFAKRIDVFSADQRKVIEDIVNREGGAEKLRLIVWGQAVKTHLDGGNYHWRIGNDNILCDWQTVGKNHLHMTLRGRFKS